MIRVPLILKSAIILIVLTLSGYSSIFNFNTESTSYTNSNGVLFTVPQQVSVANSNLSFGRTGTATSNPANLALEDSSELILSHGKFVENSFNSTILSYVGNVQKNNGIGFSIGYLLVPDIEVTENLDTLESGEPIWDSTKISFKSVSETIFNVAYGHSFVVRNDFGIGIGANLHGMRRRLIDEIGLGIGLNIGLVFDLKKYGLRISAFAEDITTNFLYWNSNYADLGLPRLHIGLGYSKKVPYLYNRKLTITYKSPDLLSNSGVSLIYDNAHESVDTVEGKNVFSNPSMLFKAGSVGLEYVVLGVVPVRFGYNEGALHFGMGVISSGRFMPAGLFYNASLSTSTLLGGESVSTNWIFSIGYRW